MNQTQAFAAANHLCRKLGEAWSPHVWENLGWHYTAVNNSITVREYIIHNPEHAGYPVSYDAVIEPGLTVGFRPDGMSLAVQIYGKGSTPKEAVNNALAHREEVVYDLLKTIDILRNIKGN